MADYRAIARTAIVELLHREYAAVWPEIEAKLAERHYPGLPRGRGIDPHHLTTGRSSLIRDGIIEELSAVTRGGSAISVITLRDKRGLKTAIEKAARRKRLLQARYLSWTRASKKLPNAIGEAGERVVHASLTEAAAAGVGYRLLKSGRNDITQLFGEAAPGGPLDDAAQLIVEDSRGFPLPITILIEVKNVRHWIYPSHAELYQLLDKAARLQIKFPDQYFLPVLVCRRAHYLTFRLAKALGFIVFYMPIQPILPHSEILATAVQEVRDGLGYNLEQTESAHPYLVRAFQSTLPKQALEISQNWAANAETVANFAASLRDSTIPRSTRLKFARDLRTAFGELQEEAEERDEEWEYPP